MSWYDFSDWGTSGWSTDLDAAVLQALEWLGTVAEAKAWSDDWQQTGVDAIEYAESVTSEAGTFWPALHAVWASRGGSDAPDGWAQLGDAWEAAYGATDAVADAQSEGSVETVVEGTILGTAADIGDAVNPEKSVLPWLVGGAIGLALWVRFGE